MVNASSFLDVSAGRDTEVTLLFTRTIRRKLVFGLALVFLMLFALSLSGISGLRSYGHVVDDLDFSINQMPRRADLVSAISMLFEPLLLDIPETTEAARYQQQSFQEQLKKTRGDILNFSLKLEKLPPTPGAMAQRPVAHAFLSQLDAHLKHLDRLQQSLGDPRLRQNTSVQMLNEVAILLTIAQRVPDPTLGLNQTLQKANSIYRSRFLWVCIASGLVGILFPWLIVCGYHWIFSPIQVLCRGAARVAQGDLDYRVELTTNDEMAELADAFNDMTARFREIKEGLDQQVRERCKQLIRSERLADVGFLAAGVAHEINNPLSAIVMATDSLQERISNILENADGDDAEVIPRYLGMIQNEAQRCRQITAKLLHFSREQDSTRTRTDITHIIAEVLSLIEHMSKFRDRKIACPHSTACYLEINGPEIKQVVLNLVANALESMERGGVLQIDIEERTDHVVIVFRDNGCGMTPEVIDNLFEPFFTRGKTGQGTGLGLSISHRIVTDHGGTIDVSSDGPGKGSTFRVNLPRTVPRQEAA